MLSSDHQQYQVPESREEALELLRGIGMPRQTGDVWAQWEYNPEEWAQFDAIDWNPTRLKIWLLAGGILIILLVMGAFFFGLPILDIGFELGLGFSLLVVSLMVFVFSFFSLREGRKRHRARQGQSHRVTFSKQGVWEAGVYFPIHDGDMTLKKVSMTPVPPVLHFRRSKFINYESTPETVVLRVLIPRGHEAEAERLRQRYQTEILDAEKQLHKRLKNPPEPH